MKLLVVDHGTAYLEELKNLLVSHDVSVVPWREFSPEQALSFDALVFSGGRGYSIVNHENEYQAELDYIKRANRPMIGICLGFELIAYAFGATIRHLKEKQKGHIPLEVIRSHPVTDELDGAMVYESHQWVITDVSKPLIGLAVSRDGYEIVMHETKPIIGFQFHPEMSSDGGKIIHQCLEQFGSKSAAKRIAIPSGL